MTYLEFEHTVKELLEKRLAKQGHKVKIDHQKTFVSAGGNTYNVDLSYEIRMMGFRYLTIVECKHWNSNVGREKVGYLKAVIDDLKAQKGIMVSSRGFQKGAIDFAKSNNIGLLKLTNAKSTETLSHFDGGFNEVQEILMDETEVTDLGSFELNGLFGPSTNIMNFIAEHYGKNVSRFLIDEYTPAMLDRDDLHLNPDVKRELISIPEDWGDHYSMYESAALGYHIANSAELRIISLQLSLLKTRFV